MDEEIEHRIQQRVDFALMLTHLYGAISEMKSAAMAIPVARTGSAYDDLKEIYHNLTVITTDLHDLYNRTYNEQKEVGE